MKRPWTPGPWLIHGSHLYDESKNIIAAFESIGRWKEPGNVCLTVNQKLASKAPEMAELLIEFVELSSSDDWKDRLANLYDKAKPLLKECGWREEE